MKNKIFTVLFFLTTFCSLSQIANKDGGSVLSATNFGFIHGDHLPDSFLRSGDKIILYNEISGTPYIKNNNQLINRSSIGKLYDANHNYMNTLLIRYNAFTDNMEISVNDGKDYNLLIKKPNSWYIQFGDKNMEPLNILLNMKHQLLFSC